MKKVIQSKMAAVLIFKGSVIFYQEGGAPEIGGDQVLCLRSKGGIKRFFQIKKGGSLIFLKK